MILSRTSQYAIQALIYIATLPCGEMILNKKAAGYLDVPAAYLAKIMQKLCKDNLIYSHRLLHELTLEHLAVAVQSGKYHIRDLPMAMMDLEG